METHKRFLLPRLGEGNLVLAPTGLFSGALKMSMVVVSLLIDAVDCSPQYSSQYSGK